jgi:hypothetical protein
MIPRFPPRFALWLNPDENPFKMDTEQLLWFAELIKQAEKGSKNGIRSKQLRPHRTKSSNVL